MVVRQLSPGDAGDHASTWVAGSPAVRWTAAALPAACSRHNTPTRAHAVTSLVSATAGGQGPLQIVALLEAPEYARAWSRGRRPADTRVRVARSSLWLNPGGRSAASS